MRRFIDEDETSAATTRRRNRAADARHGFGSPDGMELKDLTGVGAQTVDESETGGPSSFQHQPQQPSVVRRTSLEKGDSKNVYLALADLASPPPPLLTMSTESETPTPPSLSLGGRRTPPDVADELLKREASSPPRDSGRQDDGLEEVHTPPATTTSPLPPFSGMFASPATSFVSTSSSPHMLGTPTLPSFRPNSYVSPMALQARLAQVAQGGTDSIPAGGVKSDESEVSDAGTTPEREVYVSDMEESMSGSDTSFKEPFSDQVRSLNKLLLSTGKRLGKLGETSMTPDLDNDNLTKEEECLEEVRRQLQEELSMVDFSILKDSPTTTPLRQRTSSTSARGTSPTNETPSRKLEWSQLDHSDDGTSPAIVHPRPVTNRRRPSHLPTTTAVATPSSINSEWGTESVSPAIPRYLKPPMSKSSATVKTFVVPPTEELPTTTSSAAVHYENDPSITSIPFQGFEFDKSPPSPPTDEKLTKPSFVPSEQDESTTSMPLLIFESSHQSPGSLPELPTKSISPRREQGATSAASVPSRGFQLKSSSTRPETETSIVVESQQILPSSTTRREQDASTRSIPVRVLESNESPPLPATEELLAKFSSTGREQDVSATSSPFHVFESNEIPPSPPTDESLTKPSATQRENDADAPSIIPLLVFQSNERLASSSVEPLLTKSSSVRREQDASTASIPLLVVESNEPSLSNPGSSSPEASIKSATTILKEREPVKVSSTEPLLLRRRSPTYPSKSSSASATGSKPVENLPINQHASTTGLVESPPTKGDDSSVPDLLTKYGISSGYISSSVEGSDDDDNDIISTSASEDSGFSGNDRPFDEEEEAQKKSPPMQDAKTIFYARSTTPKTQNIRQIKEETFVSTNTALSPLPSQTIRRQLAPEPPTLELFSAPETTTLQKSDDESLYEQGQKFGSGENPFVTTDDSVDKMKRDEVRGSRLWKDAKHAGRQGIHTTPASFPSGKHRNASDMTLASIERDDETKRAVQSRGTAVSSSKLPFASSDLPSDETNVPVRDFYQAETFGKRTDFFSETQKLSYETKLGIPEDAPFALVHNREIRGKTVSPTNDESTERELPAHVMYTDSTICDMDLTNMMISNSGNDLEEQQSEPNEDSRKKKKRTAIQSCYVLPLLVVGAAIIIVLSRFGVLAPVSSKVPTNTTTTAPSVSRFQSETPTATPIPTTPLPSSSLRPTSSPTIFTISFETVYEIFIQDGLAENIQQEEYENDLIASMDRLLVNVLASLPSQNSQVPPRRRERIRTTIVQPSEITRFQTTDCPDPDSRNRCEQVFAYITLLNARDFWAELKIHLDLAIMSGQLQLELEKVNPGSPVAIIDMIEDIEPSPVPAAFPTLSGNPSMWRVSQIPTRSPSSLPISPSTSSLSPSGAQTPNNSGLFDLLTKNSFDGGEALRTQGSAQHKAYVWLLENSFLDLYSDDRLLQRYALATFFYSTHGEDWFIQTNWLGDMNECYWYTRSPRLPCDLSGGFQNLELDYNNLNGELPPELGLLSNTLERIVLRGGPAFHTEGTVPTELAYLTKMTYVNVRGNHFSGSFPSQLGQWTSLEQLDIADNRFTGTLPPSLFANAADLSILDISNNRFLGSLPTELGKLASCQRLNIENNMITGPIPTEIGELRKLQSFHGGSNMLSSLPSEIGRLTFLDTLSLQENALIGTIPRQLSRCQRMLILDLSSNSLSGPIPSRKFDSITKQSVLRNILSFEHIILCHLTLARSYLSELGNMIAMRYVVPGEVECTIGKCPSHSFLVVIESILLSID